jgi:hypothetical protein
MFVAVHTQSLRFYLFVLSRCLRELSEFALRLCRKPSPIALAPGQFYHFPGVLFNLHIHFAIRLRGSQSRTVVGDFWIIKSRLSILVERSTPSMRNLH